MNKTLKTALGITWKIALTILLTVAVLVVTLYLILASICGDASPAAKKMFVTTVLESGQMKFLASVVLSPEEIQELVNENSMKEFDREIDSNLIDIPIQDEGTTEEGEDIEIVEIAGRTFRATLMIVKDPSRVSLATIYPWKQKGVTLDKLVSDNGAIAGINAGLYDSTNNTGGKPFGVVVSNGEIQYNEPNQWPGLVLIGLTEDNILQIIDINGKSKKEIEQIVKDRKIRDATTFQEESSDKNNHFVQLVINGEARDMEGAGSGLNPRTAIGQRADGALLLLVTDGRGTSGHLGASASDLIGIMTEYDAVNAANLDGGSSSCMYYDGEYLMSSVTFYTANSSWYLPFGFVVK